jgi:predicted ribosomally synthesized peptide with SipW-like signal peptide
MNAEAVLKPKGERRRLILGLIVVAIALVGATSAITGAFFTDSKSVTANTFTTGTVKLGVAPTTAAITLTNMAPGDVITAPITVTNSGSLSERYSVVSTTDLADNNFLAAQLQLTIRSGVASCTTAGFTGGTVVYNPSVLGTTAGHNVVGDPTQGNQTGDRVLAAGNSEDLCFQVTLPMSTSNAYQGASTTATLKFDSEQTANNP